MKISFYSVSMDRLHHIKETLLRNIESNINYQFIEFILLDYNSQDGLGDWVKHALSKYVETGILTYGFTPDPGYFQRSHAKNMAARLATGNILCNIDADNYTGDGFAEYVNGMFQSKPDSILSVEHTHENLKNRDFFGRIACKREDFYSVGGYDEGMTGYGYEDLDLCSRLSRIERQNIPIEDPKFLKAILHEDSERIRKEEKQDLGFSVFIDYIDPLQSRVLFLFEDYTYAKGTLLDYNNGFGNPSIKERRWLSGKWSKKEKQIELVSDKKLSRHKLIFQNENLIDGSEVCYYHIKDNGFLNRIRFDYSIIRNHQIYLNNLDQGIIRVNDGFGKGRITKNFNEEIIFD